MNTEEILKSIKESIDTYPSSGSSLMAALHAVQNSEGWISQSALHEVSAALNVPPAAARGVATFYTMYRHMPPGRNLIQVCTNVACMIMGAEKLVDLLNKEYGLSPGGTSEDGRFSLIIMECIGACGTAPAMLVNNDFHDDLTEKSIIEILNGYE